MQSSKDGHRDLLEECFITERRVFVCIDNPHPENNSDDEHICAFDIPRLSLSVPFSFFTEPNENKQLRFFKCLTLLTRHEKNR